MDDRGHCAKHGNQVGDYYGESWFPNRPLLCKVRSSDGGSCHKVLTPLAPVVLTTAQAREIAAFYGDRSGDGSGALRYFARTGTVGRGLRAYLSGPLENMPARLAQLATYIRNDAQARDGYPVCPHCGTPSDLPAAVMPSVQRHCSRGCGRHFSF